MTQEQAVDYGTAVEIYIDGLQRIDILGANVVWTSYRLQPDPNEPGQFQKVTFLKVITPLSAVPSITRKIMEVFGAHVMQRTWGKWGRHRDLVTNSRH